MNKKIKLLFALVALALLLPSCNKGPGEGGTGTVLGFVKLIYHANDDHSFTLDTVAAANTDVFINYGDDGDYCVNTQTNAEGMYLFEKLRPGDYTVFVNYLGSERYETVNLNDGVIAQAPTLYIHDHKAYGTSIVKGRVHASYYNHGSYLGEDWAGGQRVYIRRLGETIPFDDTRTDSLGYFAFQIMPCGDYEIFTMTHDISDEIPNFVYQTIKVDKAEQIYELEEFEVIIISEQPPGQIPLPAVVKGRVHANYYHNGSWRGEGWACGHRVYIRRMGEDIPFENTSVGPDGYFAFMELPSGEYQVFTETYYDIFSAVSDFIYQTIMVDEAEQIYEVEEQFEVNINL